jgi:hypothetical protein
MDSYRVCEECGITYSPRHIHQKFCHHKCYRRAADRRRRQAPQSTNWVEVSAPRTEPTQHDLPLPDTPPIVTPARESMSEAIADLYGRKLNRPTDKKDQDK